MVIFSALISPLKVDAPSTDNVRYGHLFASMELTMAFAVRRFMMSPSRVPNVVDRDVPVSPILRMQPAHRMFLRIVTAESSVVSTPHRNVF
jgi:hypothetical protein